MTKKKKQSFRKSVTVGKKESILNVTKADQYKTIEELFERSHKNSVYYTLLILSAFIIASGLLLNNDAIVLGGMLVTPVLTPVLVISLGFAVGELEAVTSVLVLMLQSFLALIIGSFVLALIFGGPEEIKVFDNSMRTAVLYFIVAICSGIAATFAWTRKEVADVLPGVAIAVSLVPPLSLIGIYLAALNLDGARFYFLVFLFNFIGIFVGSLVVFTMLKFYRMEEKVHEETNDIQEEKGKE